MFHRFCFVANMAKPSWCLLVMVMYFMPAFFAMETHSAASNWAGLNFAGSFSYSAIGILVFSITHSPLASTL